MYELWLIENLINVIPQCKVPFKVSALQFELESLTMFKSVEWRRKFQINIYKCFLANGIVRTGGKTVAYWNFIDLCLYNQTAKNRL